MIPLRRVSAILLWTCCLLCIISLLFRLSRDDQSVNLRGLGRRLTSFWETPFPSPAKQDLEKARLEAQQVIDLIYNRYELGHPKGSYFYITTNLNSDALEVYKYKFAKKIMEENARYLMIFGGSSVTEGDDNRYNSSYPLIADKRLRPIMNALGIEFHVDNIAQATNNCIPYGWCYETMGEDDPDFVNWEQVSQINYLFLFGVYVDWS